MFATVLLACFVVVLQDSKPAGRVLRGKVVDTKGLPVAGVEILARPADGHMALALGRSARDGSFALPCPPGRCRLLTAGPVVTLYTTPVDEERDAADLLLVTSESTELTGTVRDEDGQVLEGVTVEYRGLSGLLGFPLPMDRLDPVRGLVAMEVVADGVLRLTGVPLHPGSTLRFEKEGHDGLWLPITRTMRSSFSIRMRREDPDKNLLAGIVTDTEGTPVADAEVRMFLRSTRTDDEGTFRLEVANENERTALSARKKGVGLAWVAGARKLLEQPDRRSEARSLVLRLKPMEGRIAGRVMTAEGKGVVGVSVFVENATWLTSGECVEGEAGLVQACDRGGVVTDADGRFELTGLQDEGYRVRTLDPRTFLSVRSKLVPATANKDLELVIPKDALHERLTVEVRDWSGSAVADANIRVLWTSPERCGVSKGDTIVKGSTDRDGRLELRDVPRRDVTLEVASDTAFSLRCPLDGRADPAAALRLVLERKCRVRLELTGARAEQSRTARFLDENGAPLMLHVELHKSAHFQQDWPLREGRSQVLTVSERATTLVLQKDKGEERVAIRLDPKEITVIR